MIGSYLIENQYKLIKLIPGRKQVVPAKDAYDGKYILPKNVNKDGILPNLARLRPYYSRPYRDMFCEQAPNCDLECQKCYDLLLAADDANKYWKKYDIGFACGRPNNIVVIDNDTGLSLNDFKKYLSDEMKVQQPLPDTWIAKTRRGHHFYYYYDKELPSDISKYVNKVDILSTGRWVVLPPFNNYSWINPPCSKPADLPSWVKHLKLTKMQDIDNNRHRVTMAYKHDPVKERGAVRLALSKMQIENVSGDDWAKIGYALCSNGYEQEFRTWSLTDSRRDKIFQEKQIAHFRQPTTISSIGVFFKIAKEHIN